MKITRSIFVTRPASAHTAAPTALLAVILTTALAASTPTIASAQLNAQSFPKSEARELGKTYLKPFAGNMGQPTCGEHTRDGFVDAFTMIGDQPAFLFGPGLYHSLVNLPTTGNAICMMPSGSNGLSHAMLVGAGGLTRWWRSPLTEEWKTKRVGSTAWQNAVDVRHATEPATGESLIVGLGRDRKTFLTLRMSLGREIEQTFTVPEVVNDFTTLNWIQNGQIEIAALIDTSIQVFSMEGVPMPTPPVGKCAAICKLKTLGFPGDRLVVLHTPGKGGAVRIVSPTGATPPSSVGAIGSTSISSADLDMDGRDDLMITRPSGDLLVLRNRGDLAKMFAIEPGDFLVIDTDSNPVSWAKNPAPAAADLDGDGDQDLLIPDSASRSVWFYRNTRVDHTQRTPGIPGGAYQYNPNTQQGMLIAPIHIPSNALPNMDGLEVTVWLQNDPVDPTEKVAIGYAIVDAHPGAVPPLQLSVGEDIESMALRSIEVRAVRRNQAGNIEAAAPAFVYTFGTRISALNATATVHGVDLSEIIPITLNGGTSLVLDVGAGLVPLGCVPCFADGDFPKRTP